VIARALVGAVAAALLATSAASAAPPHSSHAYKPPEPSTLGGSYSLRDLAGRTVTAASLRGRWNVIYFGYSRCTRTCPVALPTIVQTAKDLNAKKIPARAIFVDIEPPSGAIMPRNADVATSTHGHHDPSKSIKAQQEIAERFGSSLLLLTGSRSQLNAVTVAFQVGREHTPPRPRETGHSINHTSMIYLVSPTGEVRRYFYHTATPDELVRAVRSASSGS